MPDTRVGRCLVPEGSEVSSSGEDEGGLGLPSKEGDKQSAPSKGDRQSVCDEGDKQSTPSEEGGNMEQEEGGRRSRA